jgi:hypothetical protein
MRGAGTGCECNAPPSPPETANYPHMLYGLQQRGMLLGMLTCLFHLATHLPHRAQISLPGKLAVLRKTKTVTAEDGGSPTTVQYGPFEVRMGMGHGWCVSANACAPVLTAVVGTHELLPSVSGQQLMSKP